MYYNSNDSTSTDNTLKIPKTKDGKEYSFESMAPEQKNVVLAVIHTIVKFLQHDKMYVPIHGINVGCGGTGKSYIINMIRTITRNITKSNATLLVGAPSDAAAFNVQGSMLHHLLGIGVSRPEDNICKSQLKNVLCLIIDKRRMLS
jgi:hypothetical protein